MKRVDLLNPIIFKVKVFTDDGQVDMFIKKIYFAPLNHITLA